MNRHDSVRLSHNEKTASKRAYKILVLFLRRDSEDFDVNSHKSLH